GGTRCVARHRLRRGRAWRDRSAGGGSSQEGDHGAASPQARHRGVAANRRRRAHSCLRHRNAEAQVNDTHQQDNLSIPPYLDRRAPVTRNGALIPAQVMTLTRRINALVEKGDRAAEKAEQFYKAAGIHIKEIKQRESEHWETIVRDKCSLGRSRAY